MSKYPKYPVIVLAVICVALLIFGAAGLSTHYGDITTNVAASALGINGGLELENAVDMIFTYEGEASEEDLRTAKQVMEKRLSALGIDDYAVSYDSAKKAFVVEVARGSKSTYTLGDVYNGLAAQGKLEVHDGSETDSDGKPTGELILTNEGLTDATATTETFNNSLLKYGLTLRFSGEAKKALKEYTAKALENAASCTYSVWLDGKLINNKSFSSVISNGVLDAGNSSYSYNGSDGSYDSQAMILKGGMMNVSVSPLTTLSMSDPDRSLNYRAVLYGMAAVCALCAVCWIVRYRLFGVAATLCLAGYLGCVLMYISGSFFSLGVYLSLEVLAAFVAGTFAVLLSVSYMLISIKLNLAVVSPAKAVDTFCKPRTAGLWAVSAVLLAAAICAGTLKLNAPYAFLRPAAACCIAGFVFMFWAFRACAKSFTGFNAFRSVKLYGGKEA